MTLRCGSYAHSSAGAPCSTGLSTVGHSWRSDRALNRGGRSPCEPRQSDPPPQCNGVCSGALLASPSGTTEFNCLPGDIGAHDFGYAQRSAVDSTHGTHALQHLRPWPHHAWLRSPTCVALRLHRVRPPLGRPRSPRLRLRPTRRPRLHPCHVRPQHL
jgi:hypothetical protein